MSSTQESFTHIVNHLKNELTGIRTNQASPAMVENLPVQAYGSTMKLLEVASISAPEPQLLVVQPWDKSLIQAVESAIANDDKLQMSPVVDGEIIRIPLPSLTEERRVELVKVVNTVIEEARIAVRKVREEELKVAKQQEKNGDISEDEYFRIEKAMQAEVDAVNKQIQELGETKEAELMKV